MDSNSKEAARAMGNGMPKEISLGSDFGEVIVNVNDARVAVHADGTVETYPAAARQAAERPSEMTDTPAELKPGDRMRDGTVYAGLSPDTGKTMYTTPADAP